MVKVCEPEFPIMFHWLETGEIEGFDSLADIECNIEQFDSDHGEAVVTDAKGRSVRIRVSLLNTELFELK